MVDARGSGTVRERLLQAADELFYREGIHTVGIDRVLERAGVAKASLYGTFGSKDELVRAYLEARSQELRGRWNERIGRYVDPRERILSIFDLLAERVADGSFRGCPFVNATAEGPEGTTPAREVATAHRAWRRGMFQSLAEQFGAKDPVALGRQLTLLYDGALIGASMDEDDSTPGIARKLAERVLDEASLKKVAPQRSPAPRRRRAT